LQKPAKLIKFSLIKLETVDSGADLRNARKIISRLIMAGILKRALSGCNFGV